MEQTTTTHQRLIEILIRVGEYVYFKVAQEVLKVTQHYNGY